MTNININDVFILDVDFWKQLPNVKFQQEIRELSEDILLNGLDTPIIISKINNNTYKVIDGNKRVMACQQLNKQYIRCNIILVNKPNRVKHQPKQRNVITTYFKQQVLCDVFSNKG
jgi:ParB-like chromosome segregation protein Spo0J